MEYGAVRTGCWGRECLVPRVLETIVFILGEGGHFLPASLYLEWHGGTVSALYVQLNGIHIGWDEFRRGCGCAVY